MEWGQDWVEAPWQFREKLRLRPSCSLEEAPACPVANSNSPSVCRQKSLHRYRMAFPWSFNAFILKGRRESGTGSYTGRKGL